MAFPAARTRALARLSRGPFLPLDEETLAQPLPEGPPLPEDAPEAMPPSAVPQSPPAAAGDTYDMAAEQARSNNFAVDVGRAGAMAAEAISGAKAPMEVYDNLQQRASNPMREYAERMKRRDASYKAEQQAALGDPFSAESKRRQAAFTRANPELSKRLGLGETPYAWNDLEAVVKGTMPADTLAARGVDQQQRAQDLALKAEAEKRRAGTDDQELALKEQELAERTRQANLMDARGWAALSQEERLARMRMQAEKEARDSSKGDKDTAATQKNVDDLRKEFMGNAVVKEYLAASLGLEKVERAASDPSAAGDLALIFGYMKTLDPTSAVKETEFANAENAKGVPDWLRSKWNKARTGERLTPEQRKEFIASARTQFSAYQSSYDSLATQYEGLAPEGMAGKVVLKDMTGRSTAPVKRSPAASVLPKDASGQPTLEAPAQPRRKRDKQGRLWEEQPDGSARLVTQ